MLVLGVDPGRHGGLAVVHKESGSIVAARRMPVIEHRAKMIVDAHRVAQFFDVVGRIDQAVIELVHSMPKQGVASSFQFGRNVGAIEALVMALGCANVAWVHSSVWKKHYKLSKSKRASLDAARLNFSRSPDARSGKIDPCNWSVGANEGVAEAALIAGWWIDKHASTVA